MGVIRRYSNLTQPTALAVGVSGSATTLRVEGLPGSYPDTPFCLKVGDAELVLVTNKTLLGSGQWDLTVERGFDGTSAVPHAIGNAVRHVAIADDFEGRWQDTIVARPWGVYDDEFDDEALAPAWTQVAGTGTSQWTEQNGVLSWSGASQSSASIRYLLKNAATITPLVYVQTAVRMMHERSNYLIVGPVLSAGTTTTSQSVWASVQMNGDGTKYFYLRTGTPSAMGGVSLSRSLNEASTSGVLHIRVRWVAPNTFDYSISPDGVSWTKFGAGTVDVAFTPTHIGVGCSTWGTSGVGIATFEYLRVGS